MGIHHEQIKYKLPVHLLQEVQKRAQNIEDGLTRNGGNEQRVQLEELH